MAATPPLLRFFNQVAGHDEIVICPDGRLCKQTTEVEVEFYTNSQNFPEWKGFIPPYYGGSTTFSPDGSQKPLNLSFNKPFVLMQDLTRNMVCPCILDLKVGTQLYGYDADPAKVAKMQAVSQETTSGSLGLRITGMKWLNSRLDQNISMNSKEGKKLSKVELADMLGRFLTRGLSLQKSRRRIQFIKDRLQKLKQIVLKGIPCAESSLKNSSSTSSSEFVMRPFLFSSSLLFLYDEKEAESEKDDSFSMHCIDFAHSYWRKVGPGEVDESYLFGIDNLLRMVASIEQRIIESNKLKSTQ